MDINSLSKEELAKLQADISKRQQEIHDEELRQRSEKAAIKMKQIREVKEAILSLFEHSRTSCSDENPSNSDRCSKCALMELIEEDWQDGEFEIEFSVEMTRIK